MRSIANRSLGGNLRSQTARSMHSGGVNLIMADGSTHFVSDSIDRRVWHNLHKRDNQQPIDF